MSFFLVFYSGLIVFVIIKVPELRLMLLPSSFLIIGGVLNNLVCHFNKGFMPVKLRGINHKHINESYKHCLMTNKTKLNFLGDWINTKKKIVSIGDILLDMGFIILVPIYTYLIITI